MLHHVNLCDQFRVSYHGLHAPGRRFPPFSRLPLLQKNSRTPPNANPLFGSIHDINISCAVSNHCTWTDVLFVTSRSMNIWKTCVWRCLFSVLSISRHLGITHTAYLLTYLLIPWSRLLLEKLTGSAASQEIPRIFGTRRFHTVPTSARHLSLSWANSLQSPQPPPTS